MWENDRGSPCARCLTAQPPWHWPSVIKNSCLFFRIPILAFQNQRIGIESNTIQYSNGASGKAWIDETPLPSQRVVQAGFRSSSARRRAFAPFQDKRVRISTLRGNGLLPTIYSTSIHPTYILLKRVRSPCLLGCARAGGATHRLELKLRLRLSSDWEF